MKSSLGKVGVILIGLAISSYTEVWGADWKLIGLGVDQETAHFYDAENITSPSKNIVRVWTKIFYSEPKNIGSMIVGSITSFEEINCKEKRSRGLSMNLYSKEGVALLTEGGSGLPEFGEWRFIAPETFKNPYTKQYANKLKGGGMR